VTVHVLHYAAFDAPVDDLCTWRRRGEWVAAAGEGGTVDRDWCNWYIGRFLAPLVKYCRVSVVVCQSIVLKSCK